MRLCLELPLLAAAVAVPLAFATWCYDVYGIVKMLSAALFLALASSALAAQRLIGGPRSGSAAADGGPSLWLPSGVLAGVAVLSASISVDPWLSWIGGHGSYSYSLLGVALCWLAFCLSSMTSAPGFPRRLALWVVVGSVPVSAYALCQWGWKDFLSGDPVWRPYSSLGGSLHLGSYLMLAAPLAWSLAREEGSSAALGRAAGWTAIVLGLPALAAAGSRSAWLGVLAGIGGCALLAWGRSRLRETALLVVGTAILLVGLNKALDACYLAWGRSSPSLTALHLEADVERMEIWRCAAAVFLDHPVSGAGSNSFGSAFRRYKRPVYAAAEQMDSTDAHNDWLQVLATLGLAGIAAYAWLHWRAVVLWLRRRREEGSDGTFAAMSGSMLAFLVQTKLNSLAWPSFFLAALLAGCLLGRRTGQGDARSGRGGALALAGACLALAACCSWLAWADHLAVLGLRARWDGRPREAASYLERAVRLNPWESGYRLSLDNLLWDLASSSPEDARRMLLRRAVLVAREGVRRRPSDVTAYYLLGRAELRRFEWGGEGRLESARLALEAARLLAPHSRAIRGDIGRVLELSRLAGKRY